VKVLSLFSGVGGFDLGLERAGMETVFQCEWDKHCRAILDRHWPTVPKWDDVSTLTGAHILEHAPVIDVVAWGSPCQDLSVAGKRAGLQGERSGLFHQGVRIIKELRELTNGKYPRVSIWENVAGALSSSDGADFGQVLYEMDEAGACFSEWRLLDAQYFGVPQRRRRVFVVSVFDPATAARCPDPLLPVCEGVRRDFATGAAEGEAVAGTVADRVGDGSEPLTFTKAKRAQSVTDNETWVEGEPAPTLNAFDVGDTRATAVVVEEPLMLDGRRVDDVRVYDPPVQTLQARMGTSGNNVPMIAFSHTQGLSAQPSETAWPTLRKEGAGHAVAYSIREDAKANTFSATELDKANALSALRPSPQSHHAQMFITESTMAVRRLTPIECERLMGWPDGWTDGQADTHRYKQCGNGVASPVATWIGQQLINL
jgi:DNA (cytosine-5)-methyltransferase 1